MSNYQIEISQYRHARQSFWDGVHQIQRSHWSKYYHKKLADIYQNLIPPNSSILELGCAEGYLLNSLSPARGVGIDFSAKAIEMARETFPNLEFIQLDALDINLSNQKFDYIILSELVNDLWDIQATLELLQDCCSPETRIIFNFFSHAWSMPIKFARFLGMAQKNLPQNWLTRDDMRNLLEISGYQTLKSWREIIAPINVPIFSNILNRYFAKIWPFELLATTNFLVARSLCPRMQSKASVSVVVAARNEAGHIHDLVDRIPMMGSRTEIIFVEGNSTDNTYEVIEKTIQENPNINCKLIKQTGKGKGNAVREGFEIATGDILMILDADITVPPEDLPRFYEVLTKGYGEFANGVRLVYPMENEAMRFLNLIGNKFFSCSFSWLLGQPIRDTLCGTKVLWKRDYEKIARNRSYFGDFDPFGDFDLLFGAARLNLKIEEVPIRYRARKYGETNISRWAHGWLLLKMVAFAAKRIRFTA